MYKELKSETVKLVYHDIRKTLYHITIIFFYYN